MSVIIISNGRNGKSLGCTGTPRNVPLRNIISNPPIIVDIKFAIKETQIALVIVMFRSFL
jgi:hypothetical protein